MTGALCANDLEEYLMSQNRNIELKADDYSGIITIFGVLLAVEYASGAYDLWDIFIGILCLLIGRHYVRAAIQKKDGFYSFITGCLLSLGWVGIISGICGIALLIFGQMKILEEKPSAFIIEQVRFVVFILLSIFLMKNKVTSKYAPNECKCI